ncbi:MAG: HAAS signaling domain-containing protein [Trebonia sp.]
MSQHDAQADTESVLRAYFKELDAALSALPRAKRRQLAAEIRGHVDAALAEQPPGSPADLRNLLDRVGQPEDIAAAALAEEPDRTRPPLRTWQRVLLVGGAVVLVGAGTGVGLALSSGSPAGSPAALGTPTPTRAATSSSATGATGQPAKVTATPNPHSVGQHGVGQHGSATGGQLAPAARPYRLAARHGTARNGRVLRAGDL